uniref:Protein Gawky n=1 Tax=Cacopsylla melanoneura TaxID=428564 RepID=A0A8D9DRG0_9HEMI
MTSLTQHSVPTIPTDAKTVPNPTLTPTSMTGGVMPFYGAAQPQTTTIVDGSGGFAPPIREHRFPNAVWHQATVPADPNTAIGTWAPQGQFIQQLPTHQIDDLSRYHHPQYTTIPYQSSPGYQQQSPQTTFMQTSTAAPVVNGSPSPRNVIANNQQQATVVEYIDTQRVPEYTQVNGTYTAQYVFQEVSMAPPPSTTPNSRCSSVTNTMEGNPESKTPQPTGSGNGMPGYPVQQPPQSQQSSLNSSGYPGQESNRGNHDDINNQQSVNSHNSNENLNHPHSSPSPVWSNSSNSQQTQLTNEQEWNRRRSLEKEAYQNSQSEHQDHHSDVNSRIKTMILNKQNKDQELQQQYQQHQNQQQALQHQHEQQMQQDQEMHQEQQQQQQQQGGGQQGGSPGSWAAAAGKNLPPPQAGGSNPGPPGSSSASCKQQLEQLSTMREALYSQDGWGGQHVNQDSSWDIPASPEPTNKEPNGAGANPQGGPPAPVWKPCNVNNGTELWEANLRNGGQPPPQVAQKTPWGHTPATNIGGTWGEDDEGDAANLWSGPNAMQQGGGPGAAGGGWGGAGGPSSGQGPVWPGGPKKEEWGAGGGGWGDPRDPRSGAGVPGLDPGQPQHPHNMLAAAGLGADPLLRGGISGRLNGSAATADPMWAQQVPPGPPGPHHHIQPPGPPPGQPKMIPQGPNPPGAGGAGGNKVSHWKEMPTPPNMGGRGVMGGPPGPGALQPNPRMPVNPGIKPDGTPWLGGGPSRNGVWDGSHDPSGGAPWGNHDDKLGAGAGAPWNDGSSWGAPNLNSKPKNPGQPWMDGGASDVDPSSWGAQAPKSGPKPLTKDILYASKQFRILSEMNFKKDDIENALRSSNMNLEDALEQLNALRDWPGSKRFPDSGVGPGGDMPPYGDQTPFRQTPTHNFGGGGPQAGPGGPGGLPGANHQQMNRNAQQQAQQNQQPSAHQLRTLVQQIQMAVQAGYLNHQILNQPLAPQTLYLLNQLLQQIKVLHQLNQQHSILQVNPLSAKAGNTNLLQLSMQINKAKQYISNLQAQISSQQAIYVKQQAAAQQQQQGGAGANDLFNKPHDPLGVGMGGLANSFGDLGLNKDQSGQDGGFPGGPSGSSRLNQWKLPSLDKDVDNEFSRAPGTTAKSTPGSTSPLTNPLLGQGDGTWSSVSRSETGGWPDSDPSKDWPSSQANQQFTDLVPEFEPGKPWKGTQMKSIEDDPSITPGSVVRSPLSLATLKDTEIFTSSSSSSGGGKTSPSNPDLTSAPPLSLHNSPWSYNPPSSVSSAFSNPLGKLGGGSKTVWGDSSGPLPSTGMSGGSNDLWGPPKARGPPPGMVGGGKPPSNGWNSRPGAGGANTWGMPQGGGWSGTWVLLRNLTPQIDGSTLKTLCVQHGPLQNFHLYLNHSLALAKYSTREEAIKAQGNLNNCILGNTTIFAESPSDAEVQQLLSQLSASNNNNNTKK